jgi:hypothetical protein
MAYTINLTDGTVFAVVSDGTINTASSVTLVGKNYAGYGEFLDENFIHMLENSSNSTAPVAPLTGQLWFNNSSKVLSVFRGSAWKAISGATAATYPGPTGNVVGDLWWDTTNSQLNTWGGSSWLIAGPVYTSTQGVTGAFPIDILDISSTSHTVTGMYAGGTLVSVTNKDSSFVPQAPYNANFPTIYNGTTVRSASSLSGNLISGSNIYISAGGTPNVVTVTSTGVNVSGYINATSTATVGSLSTAGAINATGNITGGNILTSGAVSAAGAMYNSGLSVAGSVTVAGLITAVGNITGGNLSVTGNVFSDGNVSGVWLKGTYLSLAGNVQSEINSAFEIETSGNLKGALITGTLVTGDQPNITGVGTLSSLSVIGTTTAGQLRTAGSMSAAGDVYGANLYATGVVSAIGNIYGNNVVATTIQSSGPLQVNSITHIGTSGTGNIGSSTSYFNYVFATATSALYADVAERFAADEVLDAGTVVELGGSKEITRAELDLSENVFGVISTQPAYTMNGGAGANDTHPPVAMTGRVPVQVVGIIHKGDRLVSAGLGRARAAKSGEATAFNVIGRALVDKLSDGPGTVEAIVTIK